MNYRKLTLKDDLYQVAELIYLTDKFIYPTWFENYENYKQVLVDLIKSEGTLFNYNNILIAEEKGKIYGILVYIKEDFENTYNYDHLRNINDNFKYTIDNYILPCVNHLEKNIIYITNVSVIPEKRRQYVATNLIKMCFDINPNRNFVLQVLALNIPAVNCYLKQGFQIKKYDKGFNKSGKRKPKIFEMEKFK